MDERVEGEREQKHKHAPQDHCTQLNVPPVDQIQSYERYAIMP